MRDTLNGISRRGEALQYHFSSGKYHFSRRRRISLLVLTEKEITFRRITDLLSLSVVIRTCYAEPCYLLRS